MSDSATIGSGWSGATATVQNELDPHSPVTVMTGSGYTIRFGPPNAGNATFEDKHLRRLRRGSLEVLRNADDGTRAGKLTGYHAEATKAAAVRWNNRQSGLNTLVMMPLSSYCQLGAMIAEEIRRRPIAWRLFNSTRAQASLSFSLPQSLAYNANGFGQPLASGVGVTIGITVERDSTSDKILTVVHLEDTVVQKQLPKDIDRKKASSVAGLLTS